MHQAGDYIRWIDDISLSNHRSKNNAPNVPCGDCNACCRSSYFIHIRKHETETLKHIPKELLFPAPGQSLGNQLMGFDQQGKCPMLINDKCSIYDHRPQTCRDYDCRIFAAANIKPGGAEKNEVDKQVKQWQFDHELSRADSSDAAQALEATRHAATFLKKFAQKFDQQLQNPTQVALLAISIYQHFLPNATNTDAEILEVVAQKLAQRTD